MWGSSANVEVFSSVNPLTPSVLTTQLSKVGAKFPTSWSFFFWCKCLQVKGTAPAAVAQPLNCYFDVQMGVGRSVAIFNSFVSLVPAIAQNFPSVGPGAHGFASSTIAWGQISQDTTLVNGQISPLIDRIVAQDIQISARLIYTAGVLATDSVVCEVGSQLAPLAYIRPDWFANEFEGGELGGK
jgi:hypothetical protein